MLTADQVDLYIEGAHCADIWDEPDGYVFNPWCDDHRPGGL